MRRKLTTEQELELCLDYIKGTPPLQLSFKYGVATNTVWQKLKEHNVQRGQFHKVKNRVGAKKK